MPPVCHFHASHIQKLMTNFRLGEYTSENCWVCIRDLDYILIARSWPHAILNTKLCWKVLVMLLKDDVINIQRLTTSFSDVNKGNLIIWILLFFCNERRVNQWLSSLKADALFSCLFFKFAFFKVRFFGILSLLYFKVDTRFFSVL